MTKSGERMRFLCNLFLLLDYSFGFKQNHAIDLTHKVDENTVAWPSASKFKAQNVIKMQVGGEDGYWYEARDFTQAEHSGTHMDAPAHFAKNKWHTADVPLERLAGPGVKISIEERAKDDLDTGLTVADIEKWEVEHGPIPDGAVVIVHSGHGKLYGKLQYFGRPAELNLPENDTDHLHFPGVEPEAASWLAENRKIVGLGIDTPSTDKGQSKKFLTHQILSQSNIWGLENLARTDELPEVGFVVYNMVHKLKGGSGGPTRVVAILDGSSSVGGLLPYAKELLMFLIFVLHI